MSSGKLVAFLKQYSVTVTMIPALVRKFVIKIRFSIRKCIFKYFLVVHWGWLKLQTVDELVTEEERGKPFPLIDVS